jgi:hypothetical protein
VIDVVVETVAAHDPVLGQLGPPFPSELSSDVGEQQSGTARDEIDLLSGAAVAQRGPHEQVNEQPDGDPHAGVQQPRAQHHAVVAVARGQHDDRRRRSRRRFCAQPPQRARD